MSKMDAQEYLIMVDPLWRNLTKDEQIVFRMLGYELIIENVWYFITTLSPDRFTEIHDKCIDESPKLMQFLDMVRSMESQ